MLPQESSQKAIIVLTSIHMSFTLCPFPKIMIHYPVLLYPLNLLRNPLINCVFISVQHNLPSNPLFQFHLYPLQILHHTEPNFRLSPFLQLSKQAVCHLPKFPSPFPQPPPPAISLLLPFLPSMNINLVYLHYSF